MGVTGRGFRQSLALARMTDRHRAKLGVVGALKLTTRSRMAGDPFLGALIAPVLGAIAKGIGKKAVGAARGWLGRRARASMRGAVRQTIMGVQRTAQRAVPGTPSVAVAATDIARQGGARVVARLTRGAGKQAAYLAAGQAVGTGIRSGVRQFKRESERGVSQERRRFREVMSAERRGMRARSGQFKRIGKKQAAWAKRTKRRRRAAPTEGETGRRARRRTGTRARRRTTVPRRRRRSTRRSRRR